MGKTEEITVPKETIGQAKQLVEIGFFQSVPDTVQFAVALYLRNHWKPDFTLAKRR